MASTLNAAFPFPALLIIGLASWPSTGLAHRLDEYLQATIVAIEPGEIRLQINLTPGVSIAKRVLAIVDSNRDGVISTNEAKAYAELVKRDLVVLFDERKVALKLTGSDFPAPIELRTGCGIIQIEFSVSGGPLAPGMHRLTVQNRHLPALSVFLFNAAQPKSASVQITGQKRSENQSTGEIGFVIGISQWSVR